MKERRRILKMRIVFCNIAWMKYYRGILDNGVDEPVAGGTYVRRTKDALEQYNFISTKLNKGDIVEKTGEYCLGYMETKATGNSKNLLYIERIPGCELLDKEEKAEDVLVVFCATHPDHKFTTVVGWYEHATVYREYQSIYVKSSTEGEDYEQPFNVVAKAEDCVLLPMRERSRKALWGVPRQQAGASYGFGRANIWYPQNSEDNPNLTLFLNRIVQQIKDYGDENWMYKILD